MIGGLIWRRLSKALSGSDHQNPTKCRHDRKQSINEARQRIAIGFTKNASLAGLRRRRKAKQQNTEVEHRANERSLARSTVAIACLTGALVFVGCLSATVSFFQLEAMKRADITTRESFTAVQRAFVIVDGLKINQSVAANGETYYGFVPIIKNTGNTPTRNLVYTGALAGIIQNPNKRPEFGNVELPPIPTDPAAIFYVISDKDHPIAIIGPQSVLEPPLDGAAISRKLFEKAKLIWTNPVMVVSGALMYNDALSSEQNHITKYCYIINGDMKSYSVCGNWNCADDECLRDAKAYNHMLRAKFDAASKPVPHQLLAKER